MALFKPAENTSAFLKAGFMGFAGSGKTKTASKLAIGLVQYMRQRGIDYASKPAFFLDSETGSDWVAPDFAAAGIELQVAKTRAFVDLIAAVEEAEKNASVLIVDSLTHFWKELCDSYMKAKKRSRLEFQDWNYIKGDQAWGKFTDLYVNSNAHILLCGRAGFEYDYFEDDSGKKNLEKTGIKMKAEGETGFEPSLLVLMERHQKLDGAGVDATWRTATVLKDRSTLLDGKEFINPEFRHFLPHIERLNLGGKQLGVDASRSSAHTIAPDKRDSNPIQRRICLDEIQSLMVMHVPGQAAADKQRKIQLLKTHFNATWTEMEELMPLIDLRAGFDSLHRELEGQPSRYASLLAPQTQQTEMDDRLPDHSAPPIDQLPDHSAPPAQAPAPEKSIEEKLIEDLQTLATPADCTHWAAEVAKRTDIDDMARVRISSALIQRMGQIVAAAAKPEPEAEKPEPEKAADPAQAAEGAKPTKGKRRLETAEDFKKASAELQAEMGGKAPDVSMAIGG